jgi:two-component system, cell cycle sensor histidine kinase and response regulator CckA
MATLPQDVSKISDSSLAGTVLIVEDEPSIRTLTSRILRRQGYQVLEAVDGADALRVADDHAGPIEVLLTDLVMPGIGGAELASRIGGERPHLRVVYMSGYGEEDLATHGVEGPALFLGKPFRPDELIAKVRAALH